MIAWLPESAEAFGLGIKTQELLQLVWLSADLRTERSPVHFPVREHAWVAGQVPFWGCAKPTGRYFSHTDVSLPPFYSLKNK